MVVVDRLRRIMDVLDENVDVFVVMVDVGGAIDGVMRCLDFLDRWERSMLLLGWSSSCCCCGCCGCCELGDGDDCDSLRFLAMLSCFDCFLCLCVFF